MKVSIKNLAPACLFLIVAIALVCIKKDYLSLSPTKDNSAHHSYTNKSTQNTLGIHEKKADILIKKPQKVKGSTTPSTNKANQVVATPPKPKIILEDDFIAEMLQHKEGDDVSFSLPEGLVAAGTITYIQPHKGKPVLVKGSLSQPSKGFFFFHKQTALGVAGPYIGRIFLDNEEHAYTLEFSKEEGLTLIKNLRSELVCEQMYADGTNITKPTNTQKALTGPVPILESYPGAPAVVYLDFDGKEGPHAVWNTTVDAEPTSLSESQIIEVWNSVSEDFAPFNINVTTNEQTFLDTPAGSRIQCVFTPTAEACGLEESTSLGIAYVYSFNWTAEAPCWVLDNRTDGSSRAAALISSHEVGHTLGLAHDGTNTAEYYAGHGYGADDINWNAIMGGLPRNAGVVSHWSKGEYKNANNLQNDLDVMQRSNNVFIRVDDHENFFSDAGPLSHTLNYVEQSGLIERAFDEDTFKFTVYPGEVTLQVNPLPATADPADPNSGMGTNLDVLAELFDENEELVASSNPDLRMDASITTTLPGGTYWLRINGAGRGDPAEQGYSDYGSIGRYTITGYILAGKKPQITSSLNAQVTVPDELNYQIIADYTPTSYAIENAPSGMTINSSTGLITWSPNTEGTFTPTIIATNDYGSDSQTLTITVLDFTPHITSSLNAQVTVPDELNYQIVADHSPTSYAIQNAPSGMAINSSTGLITWSPNTEGTFTPTIIATNNYGSDSQTLTITVLDFTPHITSSLNVEVTVPDELNYQIVADHSPTSYAIQNAPSGMAINSSTGLITWSPNTEGTFTPTIIAANNYGSDSQTLTINVIDLSPQITSSLEALATASKELNYQITANNSPASYAIQNTPSGMTVNSSTGLITWVPETDGIYTTTIIAANSYGSDSRTLTIIVGLNSPLLEAVELESYTGALTVNTGHFQRDKEWFSQNTTTHDGIDALSSGKISGNRTSTIELTFEGPAEVSFWWKVSSQAWRDFLMFYENSTKISEISGEVPWEKITRTFPEGNHTLTWVYSKSPIIKRGADAGYLDEITIAKLDKCKEFFTNIAIEDGDIYNHTLEYVLGGDISSGSNLIEGTSHKMGPSFYKSGSEVNLTWTRPLDRDDATNTIEISNDLASWEAPDTLQETAAIVVNNGDNTETLTWNNVTSHFTDTTRGFARLATTTPCTEPLGEWAYTIPCGYTSTTIEAAIQTYGTPLLSPPIATGVVDSATSSTIDVSTSFTTSSISELFTPVDTEATHSGEKYYIEIINGAAEGMRMDIASLNGNLITLNNNSKYNTHNSAAASTGSSFAIRKHTLLAESFLTTDWHSGSSASSGDSIHFYQGNSIDACYLHSMGLWVPIGLLANANHKVLAPGIGVFIIKQTPTNNPTIINCGQIRHNNFRYTDLNRYNIIANAYPLPMSPRKMTMLEANGFTDGSSAASGDSIYIWNGNSSPETQYYSNYFYHSNKFWFDVIEIRDVTDTNVFEINRGTLVFLKNPENVDWLVPVPWDNSNYK